MNTRTLATILVGASCSGLLAVQPIPTHELRFRWRYQRARVLLLGLAGFLLYAVLCWLADYLLRAHVKPPPSGWVLRGLLAGGLVTAVLRLDFSGTEAATDALGQQAVPQARSAAREASRRIYEFTADATREDVARWVTRHTKTFRMTANLADAVYGSLQADSRTQQTLVMARVADLQPDRNSEVREDAKRAIKLWATDSITAQQLMLERGWVSQ